VDAPLSLFKTKGTPILSDPVEKFYFVFGF
jgi:hypothetical protein